MDYHGEDKNSLRTKEDLNKEKTYFKRAIQSGLQITDHEKKSLVNEATDVNGKIPEDFRCVICFLLVYDPLMCRKCGNAVYCKLCIKS